MISKKKQMYLSLQVLGWTAFTLANLLFNYLSKGTISKNDIYYSIFLVLLGIGCSHFVRYIFNLYQWRNEGITRIFHKLAILSLIVGTLNILLLYLIRLSWYNGSVKDITLAEFLAQSATFSTVYFIWGILYFAVYFGTDGDVIAVRSAITLFLCFFGALIVLTIQGVDFYHPHTFRENWRIVLMMIVFTTLTILPMYALPGLFEFKQFRVRIDNST